VQKLVLTAKASTGGNEQQISVAVNDEVRLDADTTVRFAEFIPDFTVRDGEVYRRSNDLENPAAHLVVTAKGKDFDVWLPAIEEVADNSKAPYQFTPTDLRMGRFTGLQVSHEPGQWGVWAGVVLMGIGLAFVFYIVHMRFWAIPLVDAKTGKTVLWLGGSANRNKDAFEQRFNDLAEQIQAELKSIHTAGRGERIEIAAGH
jgi:hypothetical protein